MKKNILPFILFAIAYISILFVLDIEIKTIELEKKIELEKTIESMKCSFNYELEREKYCINNNKEISLSDIVCTSVNDEPVISYIHPMSDNNSNLLIDISEIDNTDVRLICNFK